jgi:hypothetical protein
MVLSYGPVISFLVIVLLGLWIGPAPGPWCLLPFFLVLIRLCRYLRFSFSVGVFVVLLVFFIFFSSYP